MSTLNLEHSVVDDRYEVLKRLSLGSYAEIYTARDRAHNGRMVILKALNMTLRGDVDEELERTLIENFQNEAMALDKVRHPNIVRRSGHGTAADLAGVPFHYLIMEYLSGGDLQALCARQPLTLDETLFYIGQVCEGLAHAHQNGVIHRDIKPHNLLLTGDKRTVKIADFGVAKIAPQASEEITRVGTDVYAPPEHHPLTLDEERLTYTALTPSADIYSLAKTIYTLLTGKSPKRYSLRPLTELPPELMAEPWSEELLCILQRATTSAIGKRYHDVRDFWRDLAELTGPQAEATLVRPRTLLEPVPAAPPQPDFTTTHLPDAPRPRIVVSVPRPAMETSVTTWPEEGGARPRGNGRVEVTIPPPRPKPAPPVPEAPVEPRREQRPAAPAPVALNHWQRADLFLVRHRKIILLLVSLAIFVGMLAMVYYSFTQRPGFFGANAGPKVNALVRRDVSLRAQPTQSSEYLGYLREGAKLWIDEAAGNNQADWDHSWLPVEVVDWNGEPTAGTNRGFVYGSFVERITAPEAGN